MYLSLPDCSSTAVGHPTSPAEAGSSSVAAIKGQRCKGRNGVKFKDKEEELE